MAKKDAYIGIFVDAAFNAGEQARSDVQRILDEGEGKKHELLDRLRSNEITMDYYKAQLREIDKETNDRYEVARSEKLDGIVEEFNEAVRTWNRMDGEQIDDATVKLLQNVKLSGEEFSELFERFQLNPTMTRIINQKAQERAQEINQKNAGKPVELHENFEIAFKPQSAEQRMEIFRNFCSAMRYSAGKYFDAEGHGFPNRVEYAKKMAADTLEKINPLYSYDSKKPRAEYEPDKKVWEKWEASNKPKVEIW